jgi:hypothetical protein
VADSFFWLVQQLLAEGFWRLARVLAKEVVEIAPS